VIEVDHERRRTCVGTRSRFSHGVK
jgi:hypothetical protein